VFHKIHITFSLGSLQQKFRIHFSLIGARSPGRQISAVYVWVGVAVSTFTKKCYVYWTVHHLDS